MPTLDALLQRRPSFDLDELADVANDHLPALIPDDPVDARVKPEVNPRLIRHYVSEGLLDPALKDGRHAVYTVDHLLQLLALRRLLADGVSSTYVGDTLRAKDRDELRAIAEGHLDPFAGASTEPAPPGEDAPSRARAALAAIRRRASLGGEATPRTPVGRAVRTAGTAGSSNVGAAQHRSAPEPASAPDAGTVEGWERVQLLDGVELHVRDDVRLPTSLDARQRLLDHVVREIVRYAQGRER